MASKSSPATKSKTSRYFATHPGHTRNKHRAKKGAPDFARVQTLYLMKREDGTPSPTPIKVREREMLPFLSQYVDHHKDYYADILRRAQAAHRELFQR